MLGAGSYRAAAEGLSFDIRVDRAPDGRLRIISGDALRDGAFVATFLCEKPEEDDVSHSVTGKIRFRGNPDLVSGDLRLEVDDRGIGSFLLTVDLEGHYRDTFAGRLESMGTFMRRLTIEFDGIEGTKPPASSGYDGKSGPVTIAKAFESAGFDTSVVIDSFGIRAPTANSMRGYSLAEIHAAMQSARSSKVADGLNVHVLVCSYLAGRGGRDVLGIMYDFDAYDLNQRPREGVAVFYDHPMLSDPRVSEQMREREYVFTLVHEVGHALNLVHSFDKARPSALSWMQYPNLYPRGYEAQQGHDGSQEFWRHFPERFDDEELVHLHHATPREIMAGGFAFGVYEEGASRPMGGNADPRLTQPGANPLRALGGVTLRSEPLKREYAFGEPVFLKIAVTNESSRSVHIPDALDPTEGFLRLTLRSPSGRVFQYRPPVRHCRVAPSLRLDPGKAGPEFDGAPIFLSATGPVFTEPGDYLVSAQLAGVDGTRVVYGQPSVVRIRVPDDKEETFADKLWSNKSAMRAIYLRHPLVARDDWHEIFDGDLVPTARGNSTRSYLNYVAAMGWLEDFAPGWRRSEYSKDPEKAAEYLRKVNPASLPGSVKRRVEAAASTDDAPRRVAYQRPVDQMRAEVPPAGLFGSLGLDHNSPDASNPFARIVPRLRGVSRYADIVSWNIEHLHASGNWHKIPQIAELMRNFRCDFWGLQEVDADSLGRLVEAMNSGGRVRYDFVAAPGNGQQSGAIYRTDTTRVRVLDPHPTFAQTLEVRLRNGKTENRKIFYRQPLLLDVRVIQEPANVFDFRCAVVHLKSTDSSIADTGSGLRTAAAQSLASWIKSSRDSGTETDHLILGDMNAETAAQGLAAFNDQDLSLLSIGMQERYGNDQALSRVASKRLLDHIVVTAGSAEYMPAADLNEMLIVRSDSQIANWTSEFSDHIPVAVRFVLEQDRD